MLEQALAAVAAGNGKVLASLCTPDVRAWTASEALEGRDGLLALLDAQHNDPTYALGGIDITAFDVGGDFAIAEWTVTVSWRHGEDAEPLPVEVHGVVVAEFEGEQICAFRQYSDDAVVFSQLGVTAPEA